jgi:hypothetical protein
VHDNYTAFTGRYPKYSGMVLSSILWQYETPVDGRTTMSSESVCQVSRSWVVVGSFQTGLELRFINFTESVRNIFDIFYKGIFYVENQTIRNRLSVQRVF